MSGKGYPLNTIVVFVHSLASIAFMVVASLTASGFFYPNPMHCVNRANELLSVPKDHLEVCLQYSKAAGYGASPGSVDYLYSWAPTTLWVLAAIMLLPRLAMVCTSTRKARDLFLDQNGNARSHEEVYCSLKSNLGTFDKLYLKAICIDVWAIIAQIFTVLAINLILLPGKVLPILKAFPWERDLIGFTDPISVAFPSFLSCSITFEAHLTGYQGNYYGCYNSMATFYMGLFFVTGVVVLMLSLVTLLHLFYLLFYVPTPCGRRHLISRGRLNDNLDSLRISLGDLLMLSFGKQYVSGHEYSEIFNYHASIDGDFDDTITSDIGNIMSVKPLPRKSARILSDREQPLAPCLNEPSSDGCEYEISLSDSSDESTDTDKEKQALPVYEGERVCYNTVYFPIAKWEKPSVNTEQAQPAITCEREVAQEQPAMTCDREAAQEQPAMTCDREAVQEQPAMTCDREAAQEQPAMTCDREAAQEQPAMTCDREAIDFTKVTSEDIGPDMEADAHLLACAQRSVTVEDVDGEKEKKKKKEKKEKKEKKKKKDIPTGKQTSAECKGDTSITIEAEDITGVQAKVT